MTKAEKTILELNRLAMNPGTSPLGNIDPRAKLLAVICFLVFILNISLYHPSELIWYFILMIAAATACNLSYSTLFIKSLVILPIVIMIGIPNPFIDTAKAFTVYGITVTFGWLSFISILLRGILAMQATILLIESSGFYPVCDAMRKLGVPRILTTQLMMVYRYIGVLIEEAITMSNARAARGYGKKSYPLKMWGVMTGQLLLRAVDRAERINKAMLARGFSGVMPERRPVSWCRRDTAFLIMSCLCCIALYYFNPSFYL